MVRAQTQPRVWLGPEHWANPLQDWRRSGDRMECVHAGGDRNVYWLTRELNGKPFRMTVRLGRIGSETGPGYAGLRVGMRGHFDDHRDTAIRGIGVDAGVTHEGRLMLAGKLSDAALPSLDNINLTLEGDGSEYKLTAGSLSLATKVPERWFTGGVALVCHSGKDLPGIPQFREPAAANAGKLPQTRGGAMRFWFADWKLDGPGVLARPERAWGPILFVQYTASRGVLKMTVQLAPTEGNAGPVELRIKGRRPQQQSIEHASSTAHFRVERWTARDDAPFEVRFARESYTGTIRRDPVERNEIVAASLTCQGDFGFPHADIARQLVAAKPDILFFTGDQLYEANGGYAIQRGPAEAARLDYLRKWYMFGWAWGELMRHTPTVCLADDHDVYHGNVWGAGGRRADLPSPGDDPQAAQQAGQDSGGYVMPSPWVNIVFRTQSSHLPDCPDATPIAQGITAHYGALDWGGIGFALLEDRKWKSAPKGLMPEARIRNGWPQNPQWNAAKSGDVPGAQLLGERQERFLAEWAQDWREGIDMKAVVSATIFCNLCTLPPGMTSDAGTPRLPVQPPGGHAPGEHLASDHDSNGWPQTPRNRALRLMRSCLAVHLAGDQHLASTLQYGIDRFDDGPWAICSPAISNIFPRRWFPPEPGANRKPGQSQHAGQYRDGFGNHMTVHAVANPQQTEVAPRALHERVPGYALVRFRKQERTIVLENYRRHTSKMYPGWPITIHQHDNGLTAAPYQLSLAKPLGGHVIVHRAGEPQPVLTWKPAAPQQSIPVWQPGEYTVHAGGRAIGTFTATEVKV